ncbi:uncharacterized protein CEXT_683461 [Caerostris extrusa]|uniref:Odorant receptor n=1 Tax=Caerostris extrusa TaxID=172846 RepID=A0AAV4WHJ3_CAEEX|nr:uncharacterized protein CEXT_683461 [Caerostris extrusa]
MNFWFQREMGTFQTERAPKHKEMDRIRTTRSAVLPLKYLGFVKVASELCLEKDLIAAIKNCPCLEADHIDKLQPGESSEWENMYRIASEKISNLFIPTELKGPLYNLILPISQEILTWIKLHSKNEYLSIDLPKVVYWTQHGRIDYKKMACSIVKDESICIKKRYKLACVNCLDSDIRILWDRLDEFDREYFQIRVDRLSLQEQLVYFWSCCVKYSATGQEPAFISVCQDMVTRVASGGNLVATEFFVQKLSGAHRTTAIIKAVKKLLEEEREHNRNCLFFSQRNTNEILAFLVSKMRRRLKVNVFLLNSLRIFQCFLSANKQESFIKVVKRYKEYFYSLVFFVLLIEILLSDLDGCKDCNFQQLFTELYELIPENYRSMISSFSMFGGIILFTIVKRKFPFILEETTFIDHQNLTDLVKQQTSENANGSDYDQWIFLNHLILKGICTSQSMIKFAKNYTFPEGICSNLTVAFDHLVKLINQITGDPYPQEFEPIFGRYGPPPPKRRRQN